MTSMPMLGEEGGVTAFRISVRYAAKQGWLCFTAHAKRQERESEQLRLERNEAQKELDRYRNLYYEEKEKSSIFRTQRDSERTLNRFRQIFTTLGGIVTGAGVPGLFVKAEWGIPVTLLGVVLLFIGWFWSRRGEGN